MLVIPWGKIAARKIYKSLSEEDIIRSVIRLIEKRPDPSIQFSTLIDCEDVCLRQVSQMCTNTHLCYKASAPLFGPLSCKCLKLLLTIFRAGLPSQYSK